MTVTHIVAFRFKPSATEEEKKGMIDEMVALKTGCKKEDGKAYIVSITGGHQSSPERFASPVDVVFSVVFRDAADRDYYLNEDAVHRKFGEEVAAKMVDGPGGVFVMDYEHVY